MIRSNISKIKTVLDHVRYEVSYEVPAQSGTVLSSNADSLSCTTDEMFPEQNSELKTSEPKFHVPWDG